MNSNKLIPILGLLILLILAIGSISAADADIGSYSGGDSFANIELADEGQSVGSIEYSDIDDENTGNSQYLNSSVSANAKDVSEESSVNADADGTITISNIDEVSDEVELKSVGVKNNLKASNLASTIKFKNSVYATYFDKDGNIISGKLKSGDILDFSGAFKDKIFQINLPLTLKSSDATAKFTNCVFKIVKGAQGTNITDLKLTMDNLETPVFDVFNVSKISISYCDIFSNATKSYPILLNTVNDSSILNNFIQTTAYVKGWGHPSAIVLSAAFRNNISNNNIITNDSNGIYLTGYLGGGTMGQGGGVNAYNYIFNNTVHSVRGLTEGDNLLPSSFTYGIQVMGAHNDIINNTVYNVYRGIGATQGYNNIIGNTLYNIHGNYYSGNANDTGGDYAIYSTVDSVVKDNVIRDSKVGTAIAAGKNTVVSDNKILNVDGKGFEIQANNVTIYNNIINVTGFGVHVYNGAYSNISIESNVFDTNAQSAVRIEKKSRTVASHDIIIQNNTFYTTAASPINVDKECTNIYASNNIIIGDSGVPEIDDNNTTYYINEANFYNYFDYTGVLSNRIKENATLIFLGSISSKGKLTINTRIRIQGQNAEFKDTTFIIEEDGVFIDNLVIDNPNLSNMDRMWGIQVNGVNDVTIQNCNISIYDSYSAFAVYLLEASNCNVINNSLEARGNYFTVAVLSFNSHKIFLDGNSLRTIGTGETYLVNNKSCLDGYLNIYANAGANGTICPDGYTICPDGSLLCPDGVTTINAEDYWVCADGSIVCVDGTIICVDGTTIDYSSEDLCPDGSVCVDGVTYFPDGRIEYANGNLLVAGGYLICIDGSIICPDGSVYASGDYETGDNGTIICPDGTVICADGSVVCLDGSTICPDGSVICADGTQICPNGSVICADGTVVCPDGSVVCPDGSVYGPGEYETRDDGSIVCPDGTVICPDGTVVCTDGSTICPDGSGSGTVLDGVVPGSHMVSGVYRTYGFLMIHSSNITFTNNDVYVSSALGEDYNLNESYNTIAGVFVHYGGFNNSISNNTISLSSNDPIIYAIGIVGAPLNSTAVGSLNNSFTYNNISINGSYITVGILLGNKVFDSDIEYNNFDIISGRESPTIVNYNVTANNTIENNVFNTKLSTHFSFDNIAVTIFDAIGGKISYKVVLLDKEGNPLANKTITMTLNNVASNYTTGADGSIVFKPVIKAAGTYNVNMAYAGDDTYFKSSAIGKITVSKVSTSLAASAYTYIVTNAAKYVVVTLKDANKKLLSGKKITATVNGKTFSAKTNAKGVAKIKLTLNTVKTFTVSIKFAGDANYTASSKSIKVKVIKTKTKMAAPNRVYKKAAKVKRLFATLKDQTGKAIKSKKVLFVVNGKKYVGKTNAKGVAIVNVKLTAKKTYKFTAKFAGDSMYYGVTRTGKVVIK